MVGSNRDIRPFLGIMAVLVGGALFPSGSYARPERLSAPGWTSLRGVLSSAPAVVTEGNRIDVFVRGSRGDLWDRWFDGQQWQPWQPLGGALTSAPVAVVEGNRIDVFVRGTGSHLWHRWFDGQTWQPWESLGGVLTSAPAVVAEQNRIDIFARGGDRALWHIWFDGQQWHPWESLNFLHGGLTSDPFAVAQGTQIDVFARGVVGNVDHRLFDGQHWSSWESLGGQLPPGVIPQASWEGDLLTVFVQGTDHALDFNYQNLGQWTGWQTLQGSLTSGPAVISSPTRTDLFIRSTANTLEHLADDNQVWPSNDAWTSLGGSITSRPGVVQAGNSLLVFARGRDQALWERQFATGSHAFLQMRSPDSAAAVQVPATAFPTVIGTHAYYPSITTAEFCLTLPGGTTDKRLLAIHGFAFLGGWAPVAGTPLSAFHAPPGDWTWTYTSGKIFHMTTNGWSVYSATQVIRPNVRYCFGMPVYNALAVTASTRLVQAAQPLPESIQYPALLSPRVQTATVVSSVDAHPTPLAGVPPGVMPLFPGPQMHQLTYKVPLPPRLCTIIEGAGSAPRPCTADVTVTLDPEVIGPALRTLDRVRKPTAAGSCSAPTKWNCENAVFQVCYDGGVDHPCNVWSSTLQAKYDYNKTEVDSGPVKCSRKGNITNKKRNCIWSRPKAKTISPPPNYVAAMSLYRFFDQDSQQYIPVTQVIDGKPSGEADPSCPQIDFSYDCPVSSFYR